MNSTCYILVKFLVVCCIGYGACESVGNPRNREGRREVTMEKGTGEGGNGVQVVGEGSKDT